jgi:hypothetical protein
MTMKYGDHGPDLPSRLHRWRIHGMRHVNSRPEKFGTLFEHRRVQLIKAAFKRTFPFDIILRRLHTLAVIERERYVSGLLAGSRYDDPKCLARYGFKVYSQNDEDGIIAEIFNRIGTTNQVFIEFGVETGLENNTVKLLLEGWRGLWIEGSERFVKQILAKFRNVIKDARLRIKRGFVDRDNINDLIAPFYAGEIDLLSIDIDGNDIYVFQAISVVQPRVVVIEYNGKFPPSLSIAQVYNPRHQWRGSDYGGSSLAAITRVAKDKGYILVGCNITGVNAFFVRHDLVGNHFLAPYTAAHHYEPARYFLWGTFESGQPPDWGEYIEL